MRQADVLIAPMTGPTLPKKSERGAREQRLAEALRDNLRRRKEQRRARSQGGAQAADLADDTEQGEGKPPA
jgi:hypothetical protein